MPAFAAEPLEAPGVGRAASLPRDCLFWAFWGPGHFPPDDWPPPGSRLCSCAAKPG